MIGEWNTQGSKDPGFNICAYSLSTTGCACYLLFIWDYFWEHSKTFMIIYLFSFFLMIFSLFLTQVTDPGIIPRKSILQLKKDIPLYYYDKSY